MQVLGFQCCIESKAPKTAGVVYFFVVADYPVVVVIRDTEIEEVLLKSVDVKEKETVVCVFSVINLLSEIYAIFSRFPKRVIIAPWAGITVKTPRISYPNQLVNSFAT